MLADMYQMEGEISLDSKKNVLRVLLTILKVGAKCDDLKIVCLDTINVKE